jgi:hypothetical protein
MRGWVGIGFGIIISGFVALSMTPNALSAPACGTPLQWNTPNGIWANQAVWDYLHQDSPDLSADLQPADLEVAYVDLNKDATPEIIYIAHNSTYCGAHGCQMEVLTKGPNRTWRPIANWIASDLSLGTVYTRGYRDVYLNGLKLWKWTGKEYNIVYRPAPNTSWVDSQKPDCPRKVR